ncbi:MAG: phosphotransferase [Deltaproteobacteria bacterium]|nr:phosphotransferase [Deltaproteobacteria bacterium]
MSVSTKQTAVPASGFNPVAAAADFHGERLDGRSRLKEFAQELLLCELAPTIGVEKLAFLGEGAFSFAFEGNSNEHGAVVIKVVSPYSFSLGEGSYEARVNSYQREFERLALAHSSGVACPKPIAVGTLDAAHTDGGPAYMVQQRLQGESFQFSKHGAPEFYAKLGRLVASLHRVPVTSYEIWENGALRPEPNGPIALGQEVNVGRVQQVAKASSLDSKVVEYLGSAYLEALRRGPQPTFVHGDLGPQNIFVGPEVNPALLDFGFAAFRATGGSDISRIRVALLWEDSSAGDARWQSFLDGYRSLNPERLEHFSPGIRFEMLCAALEVPNWCVREPERKESLIKRSKELVDAIVNGCPLEFL